MATKRVTAKTRNREIDKIATMNFDALLTDEQARDVTHNANSYAIHRGLVLAILAKSKAQLLDAPLNVADHASTSTDILARIGEYQTELEDLLELTKSAYVRMVSVSASSAIRADAASA